MKSKLLGKTMLAGIVASVSFASQADVEIYNKDGAAVSLDASFNAFYSHTETDSEVTGVLRSGREQSRIRTGFLPAWFGANFSKDLGSVELGGRASFWVSTSDSTPFDNPIDIREFYGTIDANWGQLLIGKDFTLFNRSNFLGDEILQGYGMTSDRLGLVDADFMPFGNIGSGYIYPLPTNQITYRTPTAAGFQLAVGVIDPTHTAVGNGECTVLAVPCEAEELPRFEGELTYNAAIGNPFTGEADVSGFSAWLGFLAQDTDVTVGSGSLDVNSRGLSYGAKLQLAKLTLGFSGYEGEALGFIFGTADGEFLNFYSTILNGEEEVDSNGYLAQISYEIVDGSRVVLSRGTSSIDNTTQGEWENENTTLAIFQRFYSNFTGVIEYTESEFNVDTVTPTLPFPIVDKTKTFSLGLIMNF